MLRLIAILNGEIVQWLSHEIGLLHRGTEKFIECNYSSSSIVPYFDRLDYVSTVTQELLVVQLVERLLNCYCSGFISIWRSLLLEFYRNLNHNLNIATHAIDIGLFTTMLWSFEEREKLISFNECISGARFHAAFLLLGRLRYDVSLFWIDAFVYWLIHYSRQIKEVHNILSTSQLWSSRLYEIGLITKPFSLFFGLSGLLARSSNVLIDARLTGYEFYQCLKYSLFVSSTGDSLDRYALRLNEIIEACRIIYALAFPLLASCHSFVASLSLTIILMGFRYLASSIPIICLTGVAIGVGLIFAFLVFSISRNPSISNSLIRWSFIGFSLVEVSGFIGLVYSFLLLYALPSSILTLPSSILTFVNPFPYLPYPGMLLITGMLFTRFIGFGDWLLLRQPSAFPVLPLWLTLQLYSCLKELMVSCWSFDVPACLL